MSALGVGGEAVAGGTEGEFGVIPPLPLRAFPAVSPCYPLARTPIAHLHSGCSRDGSGCCRRWGGGQHPPGGSKGMGWCVCQGWGIGGWAGGVLGSAYLQEDTEHGQPTGMVLRLAGVGVALRVVVHHVHLRAEWLCAGLGGGGRQSRDHPPQPPPNPQPLGFCPPPTPFPTQFPDPIPCCCPHPSRHLPWCLDPLPAPGLAACTRSPVLSPSPMLVPAPTSHSCFPFLHPFPTPGPLSCAFSHACTQFLHPDPFLHPFLCQVLHPDPFPHHSCAVSHRQAHFPPLFPCPLPVPRPISHSLHPDPFLHPFSTSRPISCTHFPACFLCLDPIPTLGPLSYSCTQTCFPPPFSAVSHTQTPSRTHFPACFLCPDSFPIPCTQFLLPAPFLPPFPTPPPDPFPTPFPCHFPHLAPFPGQSPF